MTIYALSSGPGLSGLAVIRISGKECTNIIKSMTSGSIPSQELYLATLKKIKNQF